MDSTLTFAWYGARGKKRDLTGGPLHGSKGYKGVTLERGGGFLVLALLALGPGSAFAQDSSRADWRAWFAAKDSVAKCLRGPLLSRVYGVQGEFTIHRSASGGTCQAGPGPGDPTAWMIDSRLFCPDSSPAT